MTLQYKYIFFDLDRTLWDFDSSSKMAFHDIYNKYELQQLGINSVESFFEAYTIHNNELWAKYRVGGIEKELLRSLRFQLTLQDFGINDKEMAEHLGEDYLEIMPLKVGLFPNAIEILDYLKPKYHIHLITNGFSEVQAAKLNVSGLDKYFGVVVTSEEAGFKKPDARIFNFALKEAGAGTEESLMVGDDREVDIEGAKNIGMDQVLFDPDGKYEKNGSTYYIRDLLELKGIL